MQHSGESRMTNVMTMKACYAATAVALLLRGTSWTRNTHSPPPSGGPSAGGPPATPAGTATKDTLTLNTGMFEFHGDAAQTVQKNILGKHSVILGLFFRR